MGNFLRNRRLSPGNHYGVVIPAGTSATRPDGAPFGTIRFNTDLGFCEFYNGTEWQSFGTGGIVNYTVDTYTGDGSTVNFTLSFTQNDPTQIQVFVGSIYQEPGVAYTVSGLTLTFVSAPPDTMPINIIQTTN